MTDLAGLRISLALLRNTLISIEEKDWLRADDVPYERVQAEQGDFIQQMKDFLEDQQDSFRGTTGEANGFLQYYLKIKSDQAA